MTECSRCGDCCERIGYYGDWNRLQEWVDWWDNHCAWAMANLLDGEDGGMELEPLQARTWADARFMVAHWRPAPEDAARVIPRFTCDAWDSATRLCTAHDTRPPICQGYPWYGQTPGKLGMLWSDRCAFWADVPLEDRPGGKLRALPVLASA